MSNVRWLAWLAISPMALVVLGGLLWYMRAEGVDKGETRFWPSMAIGFRVLLNLVLLVCAVVLVCVLFAWGLSELERPLVFGR